MRRKNLKQWTKRTNEEVYPNRWIQACVYYLMYIDIEKITEEGYFTDTKTFVQNYKKSQLLDQSPQNCLGFNYIFQKIMTYI